MQHRGYVEPLKIAEVEDLMMRLMGIAALATVVFAAGAQAGTVYGPEHMQFSLPHVGDSTPISAGWIASLSTIADDCGMKLSKAQLQNVASRFRDQRGVMLNMQFYMSNRSENGVLQDWLVMHRLDALGSCQFAETLWGEDGTMFPGVLLSHG